MTQSPHHVSITLELLVRHLAGQAAPGEAEAVQRWLEASPQNRETLEALRQVLGAGSREPEASDLEEVWGRIAPVLTGAAPIKLVRDEGAARAEGVARADAKAGRGPRVRPWGLPSRSRSWLPAAAAAAMLVVGGAAAWRLIAFADGASRPGVEAPARIVSTLRGQRLSLRLPDGTLVTLAPSSTLRLSANYGDRRRLVDLEGEAAFTVIHDSTSPFIVRTARAEAHDLGTRFVVRAYRDDATAQVAVAEGKVAVRAAAAPAGDSVLLVPKDVARVAADGRVTRVRGAALEPYFAWADGRLVFRDTPLREAAVQLGRWYDIEVRFDSDSLGALPLTASFSEHPAAEALRLVAVTLDLRLAQAGRVFTLSPKSRSRSR